MMCPNRWLIPQVIDGMVGLYKANCAFFSGVGPK
ncbi:hypothetical protein UFOVP28_72 [uncultured Caudovirales phage]|uniref:Uncharacterized protein n=1 Tax=uncultured Caudovirales phage TaxID=2100421 RepID=A0A6J5KKW8_9CAUD|nr:hypothetical protein UFOVP28_72 [uncultured Caudovirales phage]